MDIGHDNGGESFEKMRAQAGRAFFQKFDVLAGAGGGNRAHHERQGENNVAGNDEPQADAKIAHAAEHDDDRSEEHTSELKSLMRISYAVFCLKKKKLK